MGGNLLWTKGSPPHPLPKNFFQVGPPVPAAERRGADNGPWTGKTKRGRHCCLPLPVFGVYGVPCVRSVPLRLSGTKQKRGGQSAFRIFVLGAVLFVRDPYLSWPLLPGDRQWGLSGVVPGSPSSCIKRVGRRMGALGKEGPLRASRRPKAAAAAPVATKGATGIDSRARSLLPPKNLLTCGRSAGEARRGSCGRRPACGRKG